MRLLSWTACAVTLGVLLGGATLLLAQNKPDPAGEQQPADQINKELFDFGSNLRLQLRELREQLQQPGPVAYPFTGLRRDDRLGLRVGRPGPVLVDQLDLKANQGLVVIAVVPDTAAAKAGVKVNDVLLQIGGKVVPSDGAAFAKLLGEIQADTPVDLLVMRKGKEETIKDIRLPAPKPMP